MTFFRAVATVGSLTLASRVLGYVRDADTQRYLYTEVHEQTLAPDGSVLTGVTTYHDPQGREVARKTLDYRANRTVPLYRLDIPGQRYAEGISGNEQVVLSAGAFLNPGETVLPVRQQAAAKGTTP